MRRLREAADENQGSGSGETALTMVLLIHGNNDMLFTLIIIRLIFMTLKEEQ
jgi:hypothetical protein